jgi:hypothetical protein
VANVSIAWRSLQAWPAGRPATKSDDRDTGASFRSTFAGTLSELEDELEKIEAKDVAIEIDMEQRDLRVTGEPRATGSTRSTPGLVLHFTDRRGQAITMPCDRYDRWQANARALMLTLRALRAVDRYGATASGEQYRGWTALPATTTTAFTVEQAATYLARMSGNPSAAAAIPKEIGVARSAYRVAAANTHPDRGGSTGNFQLTQESKRVLEAHFGSAL